MHRPAVDIYADELLATTGHCLETLKAVFRTEGSTYIYIANGHGAWEAALTNTLSRGDHVLVLESGRFARGWGDQGEFLGLTIEVLPGDWRKAVDPAAVEARLKADTLHAIKAILVVQIDTASGVVNDIPAIRAAIDAAGHPALFMVDGIARLAVLETNGPRRSMFQRPARRRGDHDARPVLRGRQPEGQGSAPDGLACAPPDRTGRRATCPRTTGNSAAPRPSTCCSAWRPRSACCSRKGWNGVWARHLGLAAAVQAAVTVWAEGGALEFNVLAPAERSPAVTTILTPGFYLQALRDFTRQNAGVVLGSGIGDLTGKAFRIAHMGYANAPMVLGTLGATEVALKALGLPIGDGGVQAALTALQRHFGAPA